MSGAFTNEWAAATHVCNSRTSRYSISIYVHPNMQGRSLFSKDLVVSSKNVYTPEPQNGSSPKRSERTRILIVQVRAANPRVVHPLSHRNAKPKLVVSLPLIQYQ